MFKSFRRFAFEFVSVDEVVHTLVADVVAAGQDDALQVEAHAHFDHEGVVDVLAWVEGHVQMSQLLT